MEIISVAILFVILGILIKNGKMYFLIAGYNTMSKEEQEKYDIVGISTVFRNAMFGMALIMILGYFISKWIEEPKIATISMFVSIAIGIPYLIIKSNSKKFRKK